MRRWLPTDSFRCVLTISIVAESCYQEKSGSDYMTTAAVDSTRVTRDSTTRRSVLASIGTSSVITGAGAGRGSDSESDRGRGDSCDHDGVAVQITNCFHAVVYSSDPDVRFLTSGIHFRDTGQYSFHDESIETFPHHLDLRRFDWARKRDAVLLDVAVAYDIATETLASDIAPSKCRPE